MDAPIASSPYLHSVGFIGGHGKNMDTPNPHVRLLSENERCARIPGLWLNALAAMEVRALCKMFPLAKTGIFKSSRIAFMISQSAMPSALCDAISVVTEFMVR
jgi:hypothetical protein